MHSRACLFLAVRTGILDRYRTRGLATMPRALRDAKLDTREARLKLKIRGKPFWRLVEPGLHLGYRRLAGRPGTWCLRRYVGNQSYAVEALGSVADDFGEPDGVTVLSFRQAQRAVLASKPKAPGALTVKDAVEHYIAALAHQGKPTRDARYSADALIVPALGSIALTQLTTETLRVWHHALARAPARHARVDVDEGEIRRRRQSTANRVLTALRAALNLAYREGHAPSDAAWR